MLAGSEYTELVDDQELDYYKLRDNSMLFLVVYRWAKPFELRRQNPPYEDVIGECACVSASEVEGRAALSWPSGLWESCTRRRHRCRHHRRCRRNLSGGRPHPFRDPSLPLLLLVTQWGRVALRSLSLWTLSQQSGLCESRCPCRCCRLVIEERCWGEH